MSEANDLRERMARAYMRLQCADVPRKEPWHWEVCQILSPVSGESEGPKRDNLTLIMQSDPHL